MRPLTRLGLSVLVLAALATLTAVHLQARPTFDPLSVDGGNFAPPPPPLRTIGGEAVPATRLTEHDQGGQLPPGRVVTSPDALAALLAELPPETAGVRQLLGATRIDFGQHLLVFTSHSRGSISDGIRQWPPVLVDGDVVFEVSVIRPRPDQASLAMVGFSCGVWLIPRSDRPVRQVVAGVSTELPRR